MTLWLQAIAGFSTWSSKCCPFVTVPALAMNITARVDLLSISDMYFSLDNYRRTQHRKNIEEYVHDQGGRGSSSAQVNERKAKVTEPDTGKEATPLNDWIDSITRFRKARVNFSLLSQSEKDDYKQDSATDHAALILNGKGRDVNALAPDCWSVIHKYDESNFLYNKTCYVHVTPVRCTVVQVMSSICSPQEAGYVLTYTAAGLVRI